VGPATTYRLLRSVLQVGIDRLLRVRTADRETASLFGLAPDLVGNYRASGWWTTWKTIRALRPRGDDVFLDVGSGAGRTVYIASRFPFRRVIGVERAPELHRLAQENLRRARWPGRAETELVCADVGVYPIPDDLTIVYLYNPIFNDVLEAFAGRLIASVDRHPRPLRIAYFNPQQEDRLLAGGRGRICKIGRLRGAWRLEPEKARSFETFLYEIMPATP
jgi:SAM-dependent methyltransferase